MAPDTDPLLTPATMGGKTGYRQRETDPPLQNAERVERNEMQNVNERAGAENKGNVDCICGDYEKEHLGHRKDCPKKQEQSQTGNANSEPVGAVLKALHEYVLERIGPGYRDSLRHRVMATLMTTPTENTGEAAGAARVMEETAEWIRSLGPIDPHHSATRILQILADGIARGDCKVLEEFVQRAEAWRKVTEAALEEYRTYERHRLATDGKHPHAGNVDGLWDAHQEAQERYYRAVEAYAATYEREEERADPFEATVTGKIIFENGWERPFSVTIGDNCCEGHAVAAAREMVRQYVDLEFRSADEERAMILFDEEVA